MESALYQLCQDYAYYSFEIHATLLYVCCGTLPQLVQCMQISLVQNSTVESIRVYRIVHNHNNNFIEISLHFYKQVIVAFIFQLVLGKCSLINAIRIRGFAMCDISGMKMAMLIG